MRVRNTKRLDRFPVPAYRVDQLVQIDSWSAVTQGHPGDVLGRHQKLIQSWSRRSGTGIAKEPVKISVRPVVARRSRVRRIQVNHVGAGVLQDLNCVSPTSLTKATDHTGVHFLCEESLSLLRVSGGHRAGTDRRATEYAGWWCLMTTGHLLVSVESGRGGHRYKYPLLNRMYFVLCFCAVLRYSTF